MRDVLSARAFGRPQAAAPKPVKRGDVLLTSKPFVYLVSSSLKSLYCDYCLAKKGRNGLQRCSGCRLEHYCGKECQAAAWGLHRLECHRLKRVAPRVPPDAARLMAKVILKLQLDLDLTLWLAPASGDFGGRLHMELQRVTLYDNMT